jgi:type VI secretion system protein
MASLLTRIEHLADPNSLERHTYRDNDIELAVTTHLARMLNTRQGSCLTCPDYGLIEVSEVLYDFPDAIGIMQRAIKNSIQQYEPRLKNVQVRHIKPEDVVGHDAPVRDLRAAQPARRTAAVAALLHGGRSERQRQGLRLVPRFGSEARGHASRRGLVDSRAGGRSTVLGRRVCSTSTTRTS